jgi:copper chaperone CopZ
VRRALGEVEGVESVQVDLKSGNTIISGNDVDVEKIRGIIRELGYSVD